MPQKTYKKLVKWYFIFIVILVVLPGLCIALLAWHLDPLQFFRKSKFHAPDLISLDMREQAPGLIKHYDFDSIILGTSQLENTSAAEASRKLGGNFFNLSIEGSTALERSLPLREALKRDLKKVLISMDKDYLYTISGEIRDRAKKMGALYDDNPFNDLSYYATRKNLINLTRPDFGLAKVDLDRPHPWDDKDFETRRFDGLKNWVDNAEAPLVKEFIFKELGEAAAKSKNATLDEARDEKEEKRAKDYIDENFLKYVRQYPRTRFYVIFPPYYRYVFANMLKTRPEEFYLHQDIVRYLVKLSSELPNLRLYGFEDQDFLDDITNYKDPGHYKSKFNSYFLDCIAGDRQRLTPENVEKYLQTSKEKAWAFDIGKLHEEVERLLKEKDKTAKKSG